eukprot:scaffold54106_cov24-Tisochrysis_lutea.AAC.1
MGILPSSRRELLSPSLSSAIPVTFSTPVTFVDFDFRRTFSPPPHSHLKLKPQSTIKKSECKYHTAAISPAAYYRNGSQRTCPYTLTRVLMPQTHTHMHPLYYTEY